MPRLSSSSIEPIPRRRVVAIDQRLGEISYRPPGTLTAYANNPRKHPEKQLVRLMASIEEFGFALPVLVDVEGTIITGEARVEAAKRLAMPQVPVLVAEHWSDAQVRAYRLADNKLATLGTWDEDALAIELAAIIEIDEVGIELLGWETAEIDLILDGDTGTSANDPADACPELPKVAIAEHEGVQRRQRYKQEYAGNDVHEVPQPTHLRSA